MNGLAAVVACYGLFENSPAVVIGAMIIAMLLGPISGVALGLVDNNNDLLKKAFWTLSGGIGIVYVVAFALGVIHHDFPLTDEIYARTSPNFMGLMIGLGGGAAGAYAMITPRLSVAFVGVAIATALVPPLASSAICLARGDYRLAFGAFLLAFTNIIAIQVACSLVTRRLPRDLGKTSRQPTEKKSAERGAFVNSHGRSRHCTSRVDRQAGLPSFGTSRPGENYPQGRLPDGSPVPANCQDRNRRRSVPNPLSVHSGRSCELGTAFANASRGEQR